MEQNKPVPQQPSFATSMKAVAWSFLGIRSRKGSQDDLARISPLHVMLVGFISVVAIVIGLIVLVNRVVAP